MGHVGFYNSLLIAMGNVVSTLLMYALQAAWLCQRLIDQDYRQNHGSRLTPILPNKELENSIELTEAPSVVVLSKDFQHEMEYSMPKEPKPKITETKTLELSRSHRSSSENKRRKYGHRRNHYSNEENHRLTISQPYLENSSNTLTFEYVNRLNEVLGLRRAFSDINISSSFDENFYDEINGNCPTANNLNERRTAMTDQDFLRLIFTKGYVT